MWRLAIIFFAMTMVSLPVQAEAKPAKKTDRPPVERTKAEAEEAFSPAERNLIRSHLLSQKELNSRSAKKLPPGLQKKLARGKQLPPGWQKKVAAGQVLDYQIYRQGESLPDTLLQRLPPAPIGSEILRVENEVIRLHSATRTILDAFNLVPSR